MLLGSIEENISPRFFWQRLLISVAKAEIFLLWNYLLFLDNFLYCCSWNIKEKISQGQTIGLPEPSLSGPMNLLISTREFHKTSKKAFNAFYKSHESRLFVVKSILVLIINIYPPEFAFGIKSNLLTRRSGNHE